MQAKLGRFLAKAELPELPKPAHMADHNLATDDSVCGALTFADLHTLSTRDVALSVAINSWASWF